MSRNAEFNAGREPTQAIKVWGSDLGYVPVDWSDVRSQRNTCLRSA